MGTPRSAWLVWCAWAPWAGYACPHVEPAALPGIPDAGPWIPEVAPVEAIGPPDADPVRFEGAAACDGPTLRIVRVSPWAGGGVQATLELRTSQGEPVTRGGEAALGLRDREGVATPAEIAYAWKTRGLTGVALVPAGDPAAHQARLAAATALVDGLPEGERVAAWSLGATPALLADLTEDRAHLEGRLEAVPAVEGRAEGGALASIVDALGRAEGPWGTTARALVIVGADPTASTAGGVPEPVARYWVTPENPPASFEGAALGGADPGAAGAEVATQILERRAGLVRVGACPEVGSQVSLAVGDARCPIEPPPAISHLAELPCDARAASTDAYPFGDTIGLELTADEVLLWQDLHARKSKADFTLAVRLGAGTAIPATAHFRGHTSLDCERKSYAVDLKGAQARRLMPGAAGDKLKLISMCKDEGYFNQVFANRLLQPLGLFPLELRYVRLTLNGEDHGVYLMLEDPVDALREDHVGLAAVVRRRFDPELEVPEVEYPVGEAAPEALAQFQALEAVAMQAPADEVLAGLEPHFDLDGYLRWVAFNTFLVNGDYVDEAYFYASVESEVGWYFRTLSWDPDDLVSECHHWGQHALPDPFGILFCAEAHLDQAIVRSPAVYARFIAQLEAVMEALPESLLAAEMQAVRDGLWAVLDRDATAAAMLTLVAKHPEATTAGGARAVIDGLMDEMLADVEASRATLTAKIATWRASQ